MITVLLVGWFGLNRFAFDVYPPDYTEAGRTYVVGWGTDSNPARSEQVSIFNRANRDRGLRVQVVPNGQDLQAIVTRSAAGNAPDCIDVYNPDDLAAYIDKGIARPLNAHLKAAGIDPGKETWPALSVNLSRPNPDYRHGSDDPIDARIWYAIPNNVDYPFVYFNRTLYRRIAADRQSAGLPIPHEPWLSWTWWDYAAVAKMMNRRGTDGRFISFGGAPPDATTLAISIGSGMRGEDRAAYEGLTPEQRRERGLDGIGWDEAIAPFVKRPDGTAQPWPNRVAITQALQFVYDIQHAWRAVPTQTDVQQMATGGGGYGGAGVQGQFLAGNAGMMTMGRWYLGQIRANVSFDWRMVRLPRWVPYDEWARWQREGKGPGQRDGEWGDIAHRDRGYMVQMNTRSTFISSSSPDPAKAFRFLEMLIRNPDYNRVILLEDGASSNMAMALDYFAKADPLVPDEVVNRPPDMELGAVLHVTPRAHWPFANYTRYGTLVHTNLPAWMIPRDALDEAQRAGRPALERPELAAFAAPGERMASATGIGEGFAIRLTTEMDAAGREGHALDQPPRRQWPSLATLAVFGGLLVVFVSMAIGAMRTRRAEKVHG